LHLVLWSINGDNIRGSFLVGEAHFGISLGFNVANKDALLPEQSTMIPPGDGDSLIDKVLILMNSRQR
jgi:hypothetical protein